jgi:tetratricopeptide (TPR) repeat protein
MQKNVLLAIGAVVVIGVAMTSIQRSIKKDGPEQLPTRDYVTIPIDEARKTAAEDIEAHRSDVANLLAEREKIPVQERHRLLPSEKVFLQQDLINERKQFYRLRIVQNYLDSTRDGRAVKDKCRPFLETVADWNAGESNLDRVVHEQAAQARHAGSDDPIIRMYVTSLSDLKDPESLKIYTELADQMRTPKISLFNQMYLAYLMYGDSTQSGDRLTQLTNLYNAIDVFVDYLEEESTGANLRLPATLFFRFFQGLNRGEQQACLHACWRNGKIAPWITHVAAGHFFEEVAWDARGRGFASEVNESQWADFRKYAKTAEDHYLRAWQLAPQYPEAATEMIGMATAGNATQGTTRDWFCEAIHAQFDHWNAYSAYTFSLTPRWGGSYEQQLAFAREAIATDRFDTHVPGVYLHIVFEVMLAETGDLATLVKHPLIPVTAKEFAQALDRAVDKGVKAPANNLIAWGNLARVMILSGNFDEARQIYVKHGQGQLGTSPLSHLGLKASYVRGLTFAATGPAKDDVAAFEDILNDSKESDYDLAALDDIQGVLDQARKDDTQPESQPYYDDIEAVVKQLKAYHSDEWVDLKCEKGLPGWSTHAAQFDFKNDGYLELKSSDDSLGVQLTPMARFRPPFICEAELPVFVEGQDESRRLGLIYGDPSLMAIYADQVTRALLIQPRTGTAMIVDGSREGEYDNRGWIFTETGPRHLRLIVWNDRLDCYVNRKFVFTMPMPEGAHRDQFTIGESMPVSTKNVMQVRNVRIRRLRMSPLPLKSDFTATVGIDFYRKMVEIDPLCTAFWYQKGYMHARLKEHDESITCFSKAFELDPKLNLPRTHFADALVARYRVPEAIEQYQLALKEDETLTNANAELAWIYATTADEKLRNGAESLKLADRAVNRTQRKSWRPLSVLAAAQAELGKFAEARQVLEESLAVAPPEVMEYLHGMQTELLADRPIRIDPPAAAGESPVATPKSSPE